jgi:hypothetical protein
VADLDDDDVGVIMDVFIICAFLIALISTLLTIFILIKYSKLYNATKRKEYFLIKTLQEIAYSYRVRIIRAGHGTLTIEDDNTTDDTDNDGGCLDTGSDNMGIEINFTEDGDLYFINFKVLGRCYLAYATTEDLVWINIVKKARAENRRLFSRSINK